MKIGVFYFATDYSISPSELAQELEQRGFDSLFLSEHTHIPVSRRTPFPRGDMLPKDYASSHDLFVGLSFAAAATTTLKLGTAICLVPQRDPIVTAKAGRREPTARTAPELLSSSSSPARAMPVEVSVSCSASSTSS